MKSASVYSLIASIISITALQTAPVWAEDETCGFKLVGRFIESAPRDSFVFTNQSEKPWNIKSIRLNMKSSAGNLLFDTTDSGAGVEVFQPFQLSTSKDTSREVQLSATPTPVDGDQDITLQFSAFPQASGFSFTIDVDDQLTKSELGQIRVSGGEIMGSVLTVTVNKPGREKITLEGVYSADSLVSIASEEC